MNDIINLLKERTVQVGILGIILGAILTRFIPWLSRQLKKFFQFLFHFLTGRHREKRFEREYLNWLISQHQFLGLIPTTHVVPKKRGLRLADLERVYTTLRLAPESHAEKSLVCDEELAFPEKMTRKRWLHWRRQIVPEEVELGRLLSKDCRVLIKGDPGSGKTTLLRYLIVSCARALRGNKTEGDHKDILKKRLGWNQKPFPLFLSLINLSSRQAWSTDDSLARYFWIALDPELKKLCPEKFFENKLQNEPCIILLDAFDELGSQKARQAIAEKAGALANLYRNKGHIFVATARPVGYEGQLDKYGFLTYQVQDLDEGSRSRLIRQRFASIAIEESMGKSQQQSRAIEERYRSRSERLLGRIKQNAHLRELTHNPLLLTLIVMIDAAEIEIPDRRHELYRECVSVLADSWRRKKLEEASLTEIPEAEIISRDEKIQLLAALAMEMQLRRKGADELSLISRTRTQEIITQKLKDEFQLSAPAAETRTGTYHQRIARELIEGIRVQSGILVEKGFDPTTNDPLIAFSHLSFQEYLCAKCLVEKPEHQIVLQQNLIHPAWQEVVMLYRAMSGRDEIIRLMLAGDTPQPAGLLLAAACVAEYDHGVQPVVKKEITNQLQKQIMTGKKKIETPVLRSLIKLGRIENIDILLKLIQQHDEEFSLSLFDTIGSLEVEENEKRDLAEKLLAILSSSEKLTIKTKVAIGNAVERLGDFRFEHAEPEMVLIEKGEFLFGKNKTKKYVPAFEIGKYPITNIEYKRFVDATSYPQPRNWKDGFYPPGKGNHPVVYVSWFDAMTYCRWLSGVSKAKRKYRLPTELEWEKSARGTDGREFPWGNKFDKEKCNSGDTGIGDTSPTGIFQNGVSPYAIFDAAGNVWEWTDSSYDFWDRIKWKIPILKKSSVRVVRGGSWYYGYVDYFRCANRYVDLPVYRYYYLGFRVVRSAQS